MRITRKLIIVREQELMIGIGVHAHEKLAPQRLLVSVEAEMDGDADENDRIEETLDYDEIRDFIKAQEEIAHRDLQETVARRILSFVLTRPGVRWAAVETRKPDIFDDCAFVGVRLEGTP